MLRITVEIVPFGDETRAREIGKGYIVNDGTGTSGVGGYDCVFKTLDSNEKSNIKVKTFDRKKGFWSLLSEALKGI